jgi:beta-galactosidase
VARIDVHGRPLVVGPVTGTLWRAPTDNDGVSSGWLAEMGGVRLRWLDWGLHDLTIEPVRCRISVDGGSDGSARVTLTRRLVGHDDAATHRTVVTVAPDATLGFDETITVPKAWTDLPRVGVTMPVDHRFDRVRWFGLGPHETYPDRRASALVGRWQSTIADQCHPYVVPQETGHHVDTRWFELLDGATNSRRTVRFSGDQPFGFSARHQTDAALTAATNLAEVERSDSALAQGVEVHIDAAVRGLGTAACGPDILPQYRVGPGRHRWRWRIEP